MSNYNQQTISGVITSWQRAGRVELQNPLGGTPSIIFYEEKATQIPDGSIDRKPLGTLVESATDMTATFALLDPNSGQNVGTMSYEQLYAGLYSLYLSLAAARDAAQSS